MDDTAVRFDLGEKQTALQAALLGEDELGAVIRAHIHIEHELIEFIKARLSPPDALDALGLTYSRRVRLSISLGLHKDLRPALDYIGRLRNKFAHELNAQIDDNDAKNFENSLADQEREIFKGSFLRTYEKVSDTFPTIDNLPPRDRIILLFVVIWAAVAVAAMLAKEKNENG